MFGKVNQNEKDWWAPVFRSLISYENYKNIGNAIWLYLYFLLYADRKTGILFRKYKTIKKDLGVSKKTIQRWLKRLRKCGYLVDKNLGRGLLIVIKRTNLTTLKGQKCPLREDKFVYSLGFLITKNAKKTKEKSGFFEVSKNISLKKENIKNIVIYNQFRNFSFKRSFSSKEEFLAFEIANALNDIKNFPFYLSIVKKYPEDFLLKILDKVKGSSFIKNN